MITTIMLDIYLVAHRFEFVDLLGWNTELSRPGFSIKT